MSRRTRKVSKRRRHHAALTGAATVAALGGSAGAAQAAALVVMNTNDSGADSLRAAITAANATDAADAITFKAGLTGTISLASALPYISKPLTITGPGPSALTVSGLSTERVVRVSGASNAPIAVGVAGLTLSGGSGGLRSFGADLTLTNLVVRDNGLGSSVGGGIDAESYVYDGTKYQPNGSVLLDGVMVSGNKSQRGVGGVLAYAKTVTVRNSTISGNTETTLGNYGLGVGGAGLFGTTVVLERSTLAQNAGPASGGGLAIAGATPASTLRVSGSTISGNAADADGGGILVTNKYASTSLAVENSTIARNRANRGGGIASSGAAVALSSTAVGGNRSGEPDVDLASTAPGTTWTAQRSLVTNPGVIALGAGAITGADPGLQALGAFGGPTPTAPPAAGSPLLDAGQATPGTTIDQRGLARTVDLGGFPNAADGTDIGAVESSAAPAQAAETPLPASPAPAPANPTSQPPQSVTVQGQTPPAPPPQTIPGPFATGLAFSGKGGKGTVQVVLPAGGKIAASGGGITPVTKSFTADGVQSLPVTLGKAAKKKLKKKGKLKATIKVVYTPTTGAPTTRTVTLTFLR